MRDAEKSYRRGAELDDFVPLYFADVHGRCLREFFLALLYHHARKFARVDGRVADAVDDVGDAADVVEVTVSDEQTADLVAALLEVAGVRQDVIDARGFSFGEGESAVEDENIVAEFHGRHVASYLFDAAQRNNAHGVG